jgi:hypothetical protein
MKKFFIACFLVVIMLLLPVTSAVSQSNITKIKPVTSLNQETPQFFLTPDQYLEIVLYIEINFEGEEKDQAYAIVDNIIGTDMKLDPIKLAEAWDEYGYQAIPEEELNDPTLTLEDLKDLLNYYWAFNLFGDFLAFITGLFKNRFGWMYRVINDGYNLIVDGVFLALNIVIDTVESLRALAKTINLLITVPDIFSDMIIDLFNNNFNGFLNTLSDFLEDFINNLSAYIITIIDLFLNLPAIWNYLTNDVGGFAFWLLTETPWKKGISVIGVVIKGISPVLGANVTCRGVTITTNHRGEFSFNFEPIVPNEDSFPPNEYYGLHNCAITVEKDGKILSQSPYVLSYAFSGGIIYWPFIIPTSRSKALGFNSILKERINNLINFIQLIFSNFFRFEKTLDFNLV